MHEVIIFNGPLIKEKKKNVFDGFNSIASQHLIMNYNRGKQYESAMFLLVESQKITEKSCLYQKLCLFENDLVSYQFLLVTG